MPDVLSGVGVYGNDASRKEFVPAGSVFGAVRAFADGCPRRAEKQKTG